MSSAPRKPTNITRHEMTLETVNHLVALIEQVRPDWDPSLVRVILLNHRTSVDAADLAIAAIRAARNVDIPTPKSIGWRGPHWDGAVTLPPAIAPREKCSVCGLTEERCYSIRPGRDDDHAFTPARPLVSAS